jgi:hypothetical protein
MSTQAVPNPAPVIDGLVSFRPALRSFTLLNSSPKEKVAQACSNVFTLPPVHKIGHKFDTDADGDPIPGSYVIEDILDFNPETGDDVLVLNSARVVSLILGLVAGPSGFATAAHSPFALGGISLIPRHAPKSVWQAVAKQGETRAMEARIARARESQRALMETNAKRKGFGLDPLPPTLDEMRDTTLLKEHDRLLRAQAEAELAPHREAAELQEIEDEIEFEAYLKVESLRLAEKAAQGKEVDRLKLAEELMTDPKVRMGLQKRYKIQKKGNMERTPEQLQRAAELGISPDDDRVIEE